MRTVKLLLPGLILALVLASCDSRRDLLDTTDPGLFSLSDVARMLSELPLETEHLAEVHDAVSASSGNGYDEEYLLSDLFNAPGASDMQIYWPYSEHLNTDIIIDEIAHRFPDIEFIHKEYWEGPVCLTEHIKGNYREEYVRRTLLVGVNNQETYVKLAKVLKERQSYPFFIFPLGEVPVSKVKLKIDHIIARITKIVPDQKLYCILVNITDAGNYYGQKGVFEDGKIDW